MSQDHRLEPHDEHNETLARNVHPDDWTNPSPPDRRYHLVVVGAGTAGLVSAAGAAGLGARVALIERHLMGGDCLNVGCVPSKGVIAAARAWAGASSAAREFGGPAVTAGGDFAAVMERMRALRAGISSHDSAARFRDLGIDVYLGDATFTGPGAVEVEGQELSFRRAVVATGGRAAAPPIPGLETVAYRTNETIFALTELPESLTVIGAGPIGCEMAQSFARFGAEVTLLDMAERVLPREDPDASEIVRAALTESGVNVELGAAISGIERAESGITVRYDRDGASHSATSAELLVAVGRKPNVDGLGLEAAGVEFDSSSGVKVDDRLRTSNPRVFACGDVASRFQFTHAADAQARIVIQNALFFGRARASNLVIPWCTYTSPEVAHVGALSDALDGDVESLTISMSDVDRAILDGETAGFLRVHHRKGTIVGATLVAERAGDMIGEIALAMTHGIKLGQLSSTVHPYPTQGEIMRKVGDRYRRGGLTPTVKRVFEAWFRWVR